MIDMEGPDEVLRLNCTIKKSAYGRQWEECMINICIMYNYFFCQKIELTKRNSVNQNYFETIWEQEDFCIFITVKIS